MKNQHNSRVLAFVCVVKKTYVPHPTSAAQASQEEEYLEPAGLSQISHIKDGDGVTPLTVKSINK